MLNLNGFDVRFSYDSTKIQPSSIETNEVTDDETEYFKLEDEFKQCVEFFTIPYDEAVDTIEGTLSFDPPVIESEHIIDKEGIGKVINTDGGVLLGKMSFQMTVDEFDIGWFHLVEDSERYPVTGIEINLNGQNFFTDQSTFRFADNTASKDASLSNLVLSSGVIDEEDVNHSTYKEYELTPTFHKDTLNYEVTLLEYLDNMNIKATLNDAKATMKMKVPKKDQDGNLVYEEKDLSNDIPFEFTLNKLGEPDTRITVKVTAEDGKTTNEYTLVIKRPYGTLKGNIYTKATETTTGKHIAKIRVFKVEEIAKTIDWEEVKTNFAKLGTDNLHDRLTQVSEVIEVETNDDGTYEINLLVGNYDILIDKPGYLDHIYTNVEITENNSVDKGTKQLEAGDVNKDGIIQIKDKAATTQNNGIKQDNADYKEDYDVNNDGIINLYDKGIVTQNNGEKREID